MEPTSDITAVGENEQKVITELEQRIVALEVGAQYDVNKNAIEKIEMEHLQTLRTIRDALILEQQSNINGETTSNNTNNTGIESLQKENEMLKKKMVKLEYRIQHLVSNMEILYEQSRKSNTVQN